MAIPVKLPVFEGPLDLLMHLIEKNKIDIYDIPIVEITDQYLEYVHQMDHEDMDVTSEFLVMAATLLDIKSRMLLPREKDEETGEEEADPREELVQRLLEYKMYKYLSEELAIRREEAGVRYFRGPSLPEEVRSYQPPIDYEDLLSGTDLRRLKKVFGEVLRRKKSRRDPIRSGFGKIRREQVSMDTKSLYIRAYLQKHPRTDFRALLESQESREEVIVTFLILLELMRTQKVHIVQDSIGGKILVEASGSSEEAESPQAMQETDSAELPPDLPEETENLPAPQETGSAELPPDFPEETQDPPAPQETGSAEDQDDPSVPETPLDDTIEETGKADRTEGRSSIPLAALRNMEVTAPMKESAPGPAPRQETEASEPAKTGSTAGYPHFSTHLWYGRLPLYGIGSLRRERASRWELARLSRLWARRRF